MTLQPAATPTARLPAASSCGCRTGLLSPCNHLAVRGSPVTTARPRVIASDLFAFPMNQKLLTMGVNPGAAPRGRRRGARAAR
jgi:hypothetical protein